MNGNVSKGLERIVYVTAGFVFVTSAIFLFWSFITDPPGTFRFSDLVITALSLSFFTFTLSSVVAIILYSSTWSVCWIVEGFREEED